jgi:hypothetical protein
MNVLAGNATLLVLKTNLKILPKFYQYFILGGREEGRVLQKAREKKGRTKSRKIYKKIQKRRINGKFSQVM